MKESFKRRGRPRVGTGKDGQWHVRTTPKDDSMMNYLVEKKRYVKNGNYSRCGTCTVQF